jgi:hypothetical protein
MTFWHFVTFALSVEMDSSDVLDFSVSGESCSA